MINKTSSTKLPGLADHLTNKHSGGMVVCEDPKFIYMKTAKTGGTSVLRGGMQEMGLNLLYEKDDEA